MQGSIRDKNEFFAAFQGGIEEKRRFTASGHLNNYPDAES